VQDSHYVIGTEMSSMYGICQGIKTSQDRDFILSAAGCLELFISPFSNCTVFILDL